MNEKDEIALRHQHLDSKMKIRLRIYSLVAIVLLIFIAYEVSRGKITIQLAILGIIIGLIIGSILGRVFRLDWDEANSKVTGYIDGIGALLIILYIIFLLTEIHYLATDLVLSVFAGVMLGRVLITRHNITNLFKAWKVL
jgi:ABC-type amino acid transport system permease subunit